MEEKQNENSTNDLYFRIVHQLNKHPYHNTQLKEILEDICKHFGIDSGFVYQTDYTKRFFLKEAYAANNHNQLPEMINLLAFLPNEDIKELLEKPVFLSKNDKIQRNIKDKLLQIFNASSLLFVPIKDERENFMGFIALLNQHEKMSFNQNGIDSAKTILKIVANFLKVHIYEQKVEDTKNSLLKILDHMGIDIYITDFETQEVLYVNTSMAEPYGGVGNMVGKICWQVLYNDKTAKCDFCPQKHLLDDDGKPTKLYSWDYQRPFDASWFRVSSAAFTWVDGRLAHIISSVDITENKLNEALVKRLAEYDALTQLPNRHRLLTDCEAGIERMQKARQQGYYLFFDLDNFKTINDTLGHEAGDEMLCLIADKLQAHPLMKDCVYRHGGDEFVVLCENTNSAKINEIIDYILQQFRQPWQLSNCSPTCNVSIGIANYPNDGINTKDLLIKADIAMYLAKQNGGNNAQFYNSSMNIDDPNIC